MKRNNFRSRLALIAATALTLSLGTNFTASADSYRAVANPVYPWANSYVYFNDSHPDIKEPVRYYEPVAPQRTDASGDSDEADAETDELIIDDANFPDAKFRAYISSSLDKDKSGTLSDKEISSTTSMRVYNMGISSLKGIEYFTNLQSLSCYKNNLTQLDVSKNKALTDLSCFDNNLTQLDVSNCAALTYLSCSYNNLTQLDLSNNTALIDLYCDHNNFTQLDLSNNTVLATLNCQYNNFTQLDVSKNTALTRLYCQDNSLTQLNVSNNGALTELCCASNNLTQLDVSNNADLTELDCVDNNLIQLDVSKNTALTRLDCFYNNLTQLNVSNCTALTWLYCDNNNLTQLDVSDCAALTWLDCFDNNLTQLNVSNCTALTNLRCYNNNLTQLNVSDCTALAILDCSYNYFKNKSSIIGLNEDQMTECVYAVQFYEGFKYKDEYYDISKINVNIPDRLMWNKIPTKYHVDIYPNEEIVLPSYSFNYSDVTGAPEKLVTDDGIAFMPQSAYEINSKITVTCVSSNANDIKIDGSLVYAYEPGEYTLLYTVEYYYDMGESVSESKEFVITAVYEKNHIEHEYSSSYLAWTDSNGNVYHSKMCFCGEDDEKQPHSYEVKIVPYLDGTNIYYNQCSVCGYYVAVNAQNSTILTDSETNVSLTILEGTTVDENAQLYVTDVTDTEEVDIKGKSVVYDISLKSGGVEVQPNGSIAVTIPVPEKVNGEKAKVFRKEADGSFTDMNAVYNPQSKTLTFVTDHLSIYAVAVEDVLLGDVNGDGKINNTDIILLGRAYMAGNGNDYLDVADMNSDGQINNADIILLGRLYMSI